MALNSLNFLFFLCAVITVYYLVPKKYQWLILLLASYGFYLSCGVDNVIYIIAVTLFTYGAGRWMQKLRDEGNAQVAALGKEATKEEKRAVKQKVAQKVRRVQVLAVVLNLCLLSYFKYLNFFLGNINTAFAFFGWDASMPLVNIIAPLGLSYFTFNTIGYMVDVGRGKLEAEKHLGKYALFVSFFPSIIQGPLYRFGDVGVQLQEPHELDSENLRKGALLILWGFFKKLVIADRCAILASAIFSSSYSAPSGSQVLVGVLAYSFQIYGDFSGGTDITRGAAEMMGINLPLNFERPFFATSMADFWRRWHMSLGAWMREYVFYPIMLCKPVTAVSKSFRKRFGSYAGKIVPSVAAPLVVFFLIGIWHGLTWQYIVNGLYNAILISSSVALAPVYKKLTQLLGINTEPFSWRLFQMGRTFVLLCISRIIVKAPSLGEAMRMLKLLVTDWDFGFLLGANGEIFSFGISKIEYLVLFFAIGILFLIGVLQENGMKIRDTLAQQNLLFRWGVIFFMVFFILIFGVYGIGYDARSFIYGAF